MRDDFLLRAADAFDAAATVIEAHESEKNASVRKGREGTVKIIAEKYASEHGEDLPSEIVEKLLTADNDILSAVEKMASRAGEPVETLGGSGEKTGSQAPASKDERVQHAFDKFGSWLNNNA